MSVMKKDCRKIVATAMKLFGHHGIKGTSLDEIARSCGFSKKSIYTYFENKEKLVYHIVDQWILNTIRYLNLSPGFSSNAISEMNNFFRYQERTILSVNPLFMLELRKYYQDSWNNLVNFRDTQLMQFIAGNIRRGHEEQIYRDNINVAMTGHLYFTELNAVFENDPLPEMDTRNMVREMHNMFIAGLVNIKGMKLLIDKQIGA